MSPWTQVELAITTQIEGYWKKKFNCTLFTTRLGLRWLQHLLPKLQIYNISEMSREMALVRWYCAFIRDVGNCHDLTWFGGSVLSFRLGEVWWLPAGTPVVYLPSSRALLKEQQEHQSSPDRFAIFVVTWLSPESLIIKEKYFCTYLVSSFQPHPSLVPSESDGSPGFHLLFCPTWICLTTCLLTRRNSGKHPPASQSLPLPPATISSDHSKIQFNSIQFNSVLFI